MKVYVLFEEDNDEINEVYIKWKHLIDVFLSYDLAESYAKKNCEHNMYTIEEREVIE